MGFLSRIRRLESVALGDAAIVAAMCQFARTGVVPNGPASFRIEVERLDRELREAAALIDSTVPMEAPEGYKLPGEG